VAQSAATCSRWFLVDFSKLKMEAIHSSETSVHTRSTWRHIPEDGILHINRCENLKSYNLGKVYRVSKIGTFQKMLEIYILDLYINI
jgi:hypothetical protein